jgi:nucleoside-diphosphate-sugar epimerase
VRALVTGSAGFIGRHMARELARRGYAVEGWDLKTGLDCVPLFRTNRRAYDLVVHCAFHVGGRAAIDGEPRLLARNLQIDAGLFDWAVRTGQGRVLYFSSSAAYPVGLQDGAYDCAMVEHAIDLDDADGPDARYGWAKLTGEHLAAAARESGLAVTVVRPFSGYGTDQDMDYPFPSFIARARARVDPFPIWGPGTQVRDWIHVDDVIAGALAVAESGTAEPVNLCTGRGTSMLNLALLCTTQVGYSPRFALQPDRPTGVAHRVGDPTLFHQHWVPRVSLEEGVARALTAVPA